MKVPLGSRVVLSRRRNGTVRYVGKLATESGEWYGVALDEPKGDNDGMLGKERYFYCPPNHGTFVRRKEIYCVKESVNVLKGPPSPVTDESSSCSSNISTDQPGETNGAAVVQPAPTTADNAASPLMKTFKGFRKQLDSISLKTVGPGRSRESSPAASPTSSSPSSPTARSGLKPPSPFRRFASFSQGLPPAPASPGSPTNKPLAASMGDRRRQSAIPLSPKLSPVRRTNSFRTPTADSIRPVETTSPSSPDRFSSFRYSPTNPFTVTEESSDALGTAEYEASTPPPTAPPSNSSTMIDSQVNDVLPPTAGITDGTAKPTMTAPTVEDELYGDQVARPQIYSLQNDDFIVPSVESSAPVEIGNTISLNDQPAVHEEHGAKSDSKADRLERISTFHVPSIEISAIAGTSDVSAGKNSPASSPRDLALICSHDADTTGEVSQTSPPDRTRSFRLSGLSSIFRIPSIDVRRAFDSSQGSPSSPSESSPSTRSNSFKALSFDHVDDGSEDGQGSPTGSIVPSPRDDVNEASVASAPEPRVAGKSPQRIPRGRQELTTVESLSPDKKLAGGEGGRPLFFRRVNVGRSPMERRSSYSSFSTSSSSPPKSPTSSSTANAAYRSSRVAELEGEISAMRSSHENIVAVLRATNKQHAANVLEMRAQVAALTEGNLWLERQLTAKGELVRQLRDLEKQHHRDTVSVGEVEKILEIKDTQIQTLEREMAQLRQRLGRLESDKDSQLYQQFQHYEARRERDEKRINELRKEVVAMVRPSESCESRSSDPSRLTREMLCASYQCNERLELQSEVRDLKEISLRFF
ncbi:Dynactin subunit 1 [Phytophthora pseudosyringae]|uniref:Dynactin subunit 1 n=1 Tax=Phytophthora pseudosyringae TaxID=221518 RepID=A0A8T1WMJ8_9STRA|nr:Dynactin subunit 1 [Phytophthora pseudosyringae]